MALAEENIAEACRLSGLSQSRLYALLKKHRIDRHEEPHTPDTGAATRDRRRAGRALPPPLHLTRPGHLTTVPGAQEISCAPGIFLSGRSSRSRFHLPLEIHNIP